MSDTDMQDNSGTLFVPKDDDRDEAQMTDEELRAAFENMSNDEAIETIARGLLYEKGYRDLNEETEEEMVRDLVMRIHNAIGAAVVEAMPEDERDGIEGIVESGGAEKLRELVEKTGVKLEDVMAEALEKFGRGYLEKKVEE